jgi:hypothetical protein
MEPIDRQLRKVFSEWKTQDSRRAPSFDAVLNASRESAAISPRHCRIRFAFGMAAALLVIVFTTTLLMTSYLKSRSREVEIRQWAALSEWTAPSDALLDFSNPGDSSETDFPINLDRPATNSNL